MVVEPGTDNKHKRSPMDWITTLKSSIDSTVKGTATMHPTESNLCETCNEPDLLQDPTGSMKLKKPVEMGVLKVPKDTDADKFMVDHNFPELDNPMKVADNKHRMTEILKKGWTWCCPNCNGVKGREIIISREHTSDMIKPTIDLVQKIVNHFPALISYLGWFSDWRRPILDGQTIRLSPKLKSRKSG